MKTNRNSIDGSVLLDRFVSREVAAEFLGLSTTTLATWASNGIGPAFTKLSAGQCARVRYRLSELEKFAADPTAYRPRPVAPFHKARQLKEGGNPKLTVHKARRRRGKGRRGV